jgi:hypothetical protein
MLRTHGPRISGAPRASAVRYRSSLPYCRKMQSKVSSSGDCRHFCLRRWRPTLKSYAFATAIGLILGFAVVWWVRPDTNAGTVFIVFAATLFCSVVSVILNFIGRLLRKS